MNRREFITPLGGAAAWPFADAPPHLVAPVKQFKTRIGAPAEQRRDALIQGSDEVSAVGGE